MRAVRLLAALSLLALGGLAVPAAAAAAVRDVRLTQDGVSPEQLQVDRGDTVRFVNADTFVHRVVDDGGRWDFDTGAVLPGRAYTLVAPLAEPGTFAYRGAGLDRFTGVVVVAGGRPASPAPTTTPTPAGAVDEEGTLAGPDRLEGPPPLAGSSFGGVDGLAPQASTDPLQQTPPEPEDAAPQTVGASAGPPLVVQRDGDPDAAVRSSTRLSSPVEARRLGLPLVLAAVLVGGVASLLVRLLLAEPLPGPAGR